MTATRTYRKVARAAGEEATRSALLDAAEEAFFGPEGWERTSLATIAGAAGVTKQTLLRHFGSKDGLLAEAHGRRVAAIRAQRFAAAPGDVAASVDNLLDHYEERGARALRLSAAVGAGLMADMGRTGRRLHYEWVDHAFGGRIAAAPPPDRERLRAALIALCDVHTWRLLAHDLELARAEVRATLILSIERLLGSDA